MYVIAVSNCCSSTSCVLVSIQSEFFFGSSLSGAVTVDSLGMCCERYRNIPSSRGREGTSVGGGKPTTATIFCSSSSSTFSVTTLSMYVTLGGTLN